MVIKSILRGLILLILAAYLMEIRVNLMLFMGYAPKFLPSEVHRGPEGRMWINRAWAQFDAIRGFRLNSGEGRFLRTYNHETIYDNLYHVNSQGYLSRREYSPRKQRGVKRYIVLGDSMTAPEYLKVPWPDRATELLTQNKIEFYNFAQDPSGMANWYRQFFLELILKYEFDGVILSTNHLNLEHGWYFGDTNGHTVVLGSADNIPKDPYVLLKPANVHALMQVVNENQMEPYTRFLDRFQTQTPELYFVPYLLENIGGLVEKAIESAMAGEPKSPQANQTSAEYNLSENTRRFAEIADFCRKKNKELILVLTPTKFDAEQMLLMKDSSYSNQQLNNLAEKYGVRFIDASSSFSQLTPGEVRTLYLHYDPHWNQFGSDKFARMMADKISTIQNAPNRAIANGK